MFADFPEKTKDVNELMQKIGKDKLQYYINESLIPFPIEGVYSLDEIPEPSPITLWNPQFTGWEDKILFGSGMVSVFTGYPGHGKTSFALQLWAQIVLKYNINIGMFMGETRVKPYVRRSLRSVFNGKLEYDCTPEELNSADMWMRDRFYFLNHPNNAPEFRWLCLKITDMKARYGISVFILDPFNKLETPDFRSGTETQFIGRCLDDLTSLAKILDIHIMVLAHPAKPSDPKLGTVAPTAYSISGSAHWYNKPDHIFSLWRPRFTNDDGTRSTECKLTVWKTRYEELGYPRVMDMFLNLQNGLFESPDNEKKHSWQSQADIGG